MKYVLALDQGTTSSRAILFDGDGNPVSQAQKEFPQIYPKPGWIEHDPREIWSSQLDVVRESLSATQLRSSDVAALGITNQRETTIVWNRQTGEPVHNAIVWQDRRTSPDCDRMKAEGLEPLFQEKTGLLLDAYFSGTKIRWLLDNVPGARRDAEAGRLAFGTVDSWLIWNLTGGRVHATDVSNASRTLLFNIHTQSWDDELLKVLDIPRSVFPEVLPSSGIVGETTSDLLGAAVPVAGVAGDQQAALFGQGCLESGTGKNTYGTGCFVLMNTGEAPVSSKNRLISTVAWRLADRTQYALEGSIFIAGAAVQWLRDGLGILRDSSDVEALATSVDDTGGVTFVPAFAGLGAPHWDPYARGTLLGLSRGATSAHIARATLEAIGHQVADVVSAMEADSGIRFEQLRVDGGAASNDFLMQFQADILGVPVVRPQVSETTALGAAYLAGLATGYWKSAEALGENLKIDRIFEPSMSGDRRDALREEWRRALERAKAWASA